MFKKCMCCMSCCKWIKKLLFAAWFGMSSLCVLATQRFIKQGRKDVLCSQSYTVICNPCANATRGALRHSIFKPAGQLYRSHMPLSVQPLRKYTSKIYCPPVARQLLDYYFQSWRGHTSPTRRSSILMSRSPAGDLLHYRLLICC